MERNLGHFIRTHSYLKPRALIFESQKTTGKHVSLCSVFDSYIWKPTDKGNRKLPQVMTRTTWSILSLASSGSTIRNGNVSPVPSRRLRCACCEFGKTRSSSSTRWRLRAMAAVCAPPPRRNCSRSRFRSSAPRCVVTINFVSDRNLQVRVTEIIQRLWAFMNFGLF